MLDDLVQEVAIRARFQLGDQSPQRLADVPHQAEVHGRPTAEMQGLVIDLDDRLSVREERVVGEVRAQHQQQVAVSQRLCGATPAQETRHPDRGRIVGLEHVLPAVGERDRCLQDLGEAQHLVARVPGPFATMDRDPFSTRDQRHCLREGRIVGSHHRTVGEDRVAQHRAVHILGRDVSREDDHPDAAL